MKQVYAQYKTAIWLVLGALVLITLVYFASSIYKWIKAQFDPSQQLDIEEENLSYSVPEFELFADQLESAMQGLGTDESAVYHVFNQMNTSDDLKQLIKSFGVRELGWSGEKNLLQWLRAEMNVDDLIPIQTIFNNAGVAF